MRPGAAVAAVGVALVSGRLRCVARSTGVPSRGAAPRRDRSRRKEDAKSRERAGPQTVRVRRSTALAAARARGRDAAATSTATGRRTHLHFVRARPYGRIREKGTSSMPVIRRAIALVVTVAALNTGLASPSHADHRLEPQIGSVCDPHKAAPVPAAVDFWVQ